MRCLEKCQRQIDKVINLFQNEKKELLNVMQRSRKGNNQFFQ